MLSTQEIKQKFIEFFEAKKHAHVTNSSLVPLNDPSVLFTTAGMHPLVPYLLGQPHPQGNRLVNTQRCLRTNDIEEVGDTTHLTFFEMLGYWSLGDYFKEDAIKFTFEFFTSPAYINFDPQRLYVTVFAGDADAPVDAKSIQTWQQVFAEKDIEANVWNQNDFAENNLRIFPLDKSENWWGPAGTTGPCGPDSELFYWIGEGEPDFNKYVPWDDSGMFVEISNDVFMEFNKDEQGNFSPLQQKNVDFGGGLERIAMISQHKNEAGAVPTTVSVYDSDKLQSLLQKLESLSGTTYERDNEHAYSFRLIVDHMRAAVFVIADGVTPSNKDQGYVLRRLLRRAMRHGMHLGLETSFSQQFAQKVIDIYQTDYAHLHTNANNILQEIRQEADKFSQTLNTGLKEIRKLKHDGKELTGELAFYIYETFGFPLEMTFDEFAITDETKVEKITEKFNQSLEEHKKQSRAGAEQKFRGGLADDSEATTKLHTAHHLLLRALQDVLGEDVHQKGSNITAERLRIDFNYPEKLTPEQKQEVEKIVNQKIAEGLNVIRTELPKTTAEQIGAEMEFGQRYPENVSVYFITAATREELEANLHKDKPEKIWYSAEFCGGPHVENTQELGHFQIKKEESSSAGIRRIKAILQ